METKNNINSWWEYSFNQSQLNDQSILKTIYNLVSDTNTGLKYNESLIPIYKEMDILSDKYDMVANELKLKLNHLFLQLQNLVVKKSNFSLLFYSNS